METPEPSRRHATVKIEDGSRDHGRSYYLTEMPAPTAFKWFTRAVNAVAKAGVSTELIRPGMGPEFFAVVGIDALFRAPWDMAEPLLDEMMECVQFQMENGQARKLLPDDIQEVSTIFRLREEVATLHLGFSLRERLSALRDSLFKPPPTSPPTTT